MQHGAQGMFMAPAALKRPCVFVIILQVQWQHQVRAPELPAGLAGALWQHRAL